MRPTLFVLLLSIVVAATLQLGFKAPPPRAPFESLDCDFRVSRDPALVQAPDGWHCDAASFDNVKRLTLKVRNQGTLVFENCTTVRFWRRDGKLTGVTIWTPPCSTPEAVALVNRYMDRLQVATEARGLDQWVQDVERTVASGRYLQPQYMKTANEQVGFWIQFGGFKAGRKPYWAPHIDIKF